LTAQPFTATITGSPRIGPRRELKRATEGYWAKRTSRAELESVGATLRRDTWSDLAAAGLDSVPVNTFSYYDQMLDTTVLLGALPARVHGVADELDRYFAAARGNDDISPLEMTKWFDTNYHYLVPEISPDTRFALNPAKVIAELKESLAQGIPARPVIIGPITFLLLSKAVDGAGAPIQRLDDLVPVYAELLSALADAGAQWVQLDEPVLVTDISADAPQLAEKVYTALGSVSNRPAVHVATYFGEPGAALAALARTPVEAIGVDLVAGADTAMARISGVPELAGKTLVAGIVSGRNVWRTDLESALSRLATLLGSAGTVAVSTSCSTLHVPYSLALETELPDENLRSWLAFGAEKVHEVVTLARALRDGRDAVADEIAASAAAMRSRRSDPRLHNDSIRARIESIMASGTKRGNAADRRDSQTARLRLPPLPTTTIGSYPQTPEIRKARAALRSGEIDSAEYRRRMQAEIANVVRLQEQLGLDVLVHGEP
jgi:5-methyltetrahydropteroyltriglutamate--homocysteine methyltransferase